MTIPNGTSYEIFQTVAHPGWNGKDDGLCKAIGQEWFIERRSATLIVPSIPARIERNILINPQHPDTAKITKLRTISWSQSRGMNVFMDNRPRGED